jgi:hypothetical protein
MTVENTHPGAIQSPGWDDDDDGLGELEQGEGGISRITIDHKTNTFTDKATGEMISGEDGLECVILGLVRQRLMWPLKQDTGDVPQCKSPDSTHGFPLTDPEKPASKRFDFAKAGFNESQAMIPNPQTGVVMVACDQCQMKEWGAQKGDKPQCSEQFTLPILYRSGSGELVPAVISFQRSALRATKSYLGKYKAMRSPSFVNFTRIKLSRQTQGTVEYSVPGFMQEGSTPADDHMEYSETFRNLRGYLKELPRDKTVYAEATVEGGAQPAIQAAPAPAPAAAPVAAPAPVYAETVPDHPAPVAQAPAQAAAPAAPAAPAPPAPVAAPAPPAAAPAAYTSPPGMNPQDDPNSPEYIPF